MRFRGPLADSYWSAVALVLFALTPFLVLSSALFPLGEGEEPALHSPALGGD